MIEEEAFNENGVLILSSEMKALLKISQEQIKNGQFKSNEKVMQETNLLLKKSHKLGQILARKFIWNTFF